MCGTAWREVPQGIQEREQKNETQFFPVVMAQDLLALSSNPVPKGNVGSVGRDR